jgi:sugar lactone lactonase YvrE
MKIVHTLLLFACLLTACSPKPSETQSQAISFEQIADQSAQLGEGPIWHHIEKKLYWIDIEGKKLHIYDPASGKTKTIGTPQKLGTVVPCEKGGVLLALSTGVHWLDPQSDSLVFLHNPETDKPENRLNDGKCDPSGRFWFGSIGKEKQAALYRMDLDGKVTKMLDSVTVSNGIVWTADRKTMYYADSPTRKIFAFDYEDASGNISNRRVAVQIPDSLGYPDGMSIDSEDMLWVGHWEGACVARWNPKNGQMLEQIRLPALQVTACAFTDDDLKTLYITSAKMELSEEKQKKYPQSGGLFKARTSVAGTKSFFFKGDPKAIAQKNLVKK